MNFGSVPAGMNEKAVENFHPENPVPAFSWTTETFSEDEIDDKENVFDNNRFLEVIEEGDEQNMIQESTAQKEV